MTFLLERKRGVKDLIMCLEPVGGYLSVYQRFVRRWMCGVKLKDRLPSKEDAFVWMVMGQHAIAHETGSTQRIQNVAREGPSYGHR